MNCTLGSGAVDAIDLGAYTKTSFVPLQKGIRIEGKSAWGDWEHNRCAECELKNYPVYSCTSKFIKIVVELFRVSFTSHSF